MTTTATIEAQPRARSPLLLPLLCIAQFMVILDVSVVNIAIPTIQKALKVSPENIQWVAIGYGLTLGGFLLFGGRSADLLGRRRVLIAGVAVFTLSSLGCGASNSIGLLILFRVTQGLGAAFIAPAALSTLTTAFEEGPERNKALGIWGALGGVGAIVGVLLGGIITETLGWRWIFLINVPVGVLLVIGALREIPETAGEAGHRHFDIPGAVTVTSGLMLGVYAINRSIEHGWTSSTTLGCVAASVVLLVAFVTIESRTAVPLMHLALFKVRTVTVANILAFVAFGAEFAAFFLLALYMQQVLGYSALKTGLAYLPLGLMGVAGATSASVLVTKVGPKAIAVIGMVVNAVVFLLYTLAPADASYVTHLLPAFLLTGIGLGFCAVSIQVAAFSGVTESESGLAAGLINTTQEIGGASVIAIAATIAISGARNYIVSHGGNPALGGEAFTHGMHTAFTVLAVLSVVAALTALLGLPGSGPPPPPNAHQTTRPRAPKPIHQHATDAQRAHVARHGHVGALVSDGDVAAATEPPVELKAARAVRKAPAKKAAPAKKRTPAKKATAKKATIKKATPAKTTATAAKKATKRTPPRRG